MKNIDHFLALGEPPASTDPPAPKTDWTLPIALGAAGVALVSAGWLMSSENVSKEAPRSNPTGQRQRLESIAEGLLKWHGSLQLAAFDVLIWTEGSIVRIAFQGKALSIERNVYGRDLIPNRNHDLDISLQRSVGLSAEPVVQGRRVVGVDSELGQLIDSDETAFYQLLYAVSQTVRHVLDPESTTKTRVVTVLMPLEGAPLRTFYSARKRAWQPAGQGPPSINVEVDYEDSSGKISRKFVTGADMCRIFTRTSSCGKEILARGSVYRSDFMVFHATRPNADSANHVKSCEGWLFPSLGVGLIPSVMFGPLVLIASVDLVLAALKPYKKTRGAFPIHIYDTDTWTIRSSDTPRASQRLYKQLTGTYVDDMYDEHHQWILGAPMTTVAPFGERRKAKVITTTRSLSNELVQRLKVWKYGQRAAHLSRVGKHHYPYLEAKANTILDPSCWQLAVCPARWESRVREYMRITGIKATLLTVPYVESSATNDDSSGWKFIVTTPVKAETVTPNEPDKWTWTIDEDEALAYSDIVADTVRDYAQEHGLIRDYVF